MIQARLMHIVVVVILVIIQKSNCRSFENLDQNADEPENRINSIPNNSSNLDELKLNENEENRKVEIFLPPFNVITTTEENAEDPQNRDLLIAKKERVTVTKNKYILIPDSAESEPLSSNEGFIITGSREASGSGTGYVTNQRKYVQQPVLTNVLIRAPAMEASQEAGGVYYGGLATAGPLHGTYGSHINYALPTVAGGQIDNSAESGVITSMEQTNQGYIQPKSMESEGYVLMKMPYQLQGANLMNYADESNQPRFVRLSNSAGSYESGDNYPAYPLQYASGEFGTQGQLRQSTKCNLAELLEKYKDHLASLNTNLEQDANLSPESIEETILKHPEHLARNLDGMDTVEESREPVNFIQPREPRRTEGPIQIGYQPANGIHFIPEIYRQVHAPNSLPMLQIPKIGQPIQIGYHPESEIHLVPNQPDTHQQVQVGNELHLIPNQLQFGPVPHVTKIEEPIQIEYQPEEEIHLIPNQPEVHVPEFVPMQQAPEIEEPIDSGIHLVPNQPEVYIPQFAPMPQIPNVEYPIISEPHAEIVDPPVIPEANMIPIVNPMPIQTVEMVPQNEPQFIHVPELQQIPVHMPEPQQIPVLLPQPQSPQIPVHIPEPQHIPVLLPQPQQIPVHIQEPQQIPVLLPQPQQIPIHISQPPQFPVHIPEQMNIEPEIPDLNPVIMQKNVPFETVPVNPPTPIIITNEVPTVPEPSPTIPIIVQNEYQPDPVIPTDMIITPIVEESIPVITHEVPMVEYSETDVEPDFIQFPTKEAIPQHEIVPVHETEYIVIPTENEPIPTAPEVTIIELEPEIPQVSVIVEEPQPEILPTIETLPVDSYPTFVVPTANIPEVPVAEPTQFYIELPPANEEPEIEESREYPELEPSIIPVEVEHEPTNILLEAEPTLVVNPTRDLVQYVSREPCNDAQRTESPIIPNHLQSPEFLCKLHDLIEKLKHESSLYPDFAFLPTVITIFETYLKFVSYDIDLESILYNCPHHPELMDNPYDPNHYDPNQYEPNHYDPNHYEPNHYDPNHYEPNYFNPNNYDPNHYESNYDPTQYQPNYDPNQYEPNYDPNQYEPNYDPNQYEPNYDPNHYDQIQKWTPHSNNPNHYTNWPHILAPTEESFDHELPYQLPNHPEQTFEPIYGDNAEYPDFSKQPESNFWHTIPDYDYDYSNEMPDLISPTFAPKLPEYNFPKLLKPTVNYDRYLPQSPTPLVLLSRPTLAPYSDIWSHIPYERQTRPNLPRSTVIPFNKLKPPSPTNLCPCPDSNFRPDFPFDDITPSSELKPSDIMNCRRLFNIVKSKNPHIDDLELANMIIRILTSYFNLGTNSLNHNHNFGTDPIWQGTSTITA